MTAVAGGLFEGDGWMFVAAITVLPMLVLATTSFVKISVVLSILRNALGIAGVPSGAVVTLMALILSWYVMAPVGQAVMARITPLLPVASARAVGAPALRWTEPRSVVRQDKSATSQLALALEIFRQGKQPLIEFLQRNSGRRERQLFVDLAVRGWRSATTASAALSPAIDRGDLMVVVPAFLVTELAEAFQIGFLLLLPFLVVDLLAALVLGALGMQGLSPATVALPCKLLLFVLADGWYVLARALVLGYR